MMIVDDILAFPVKGIFWIFQEIHKAAQEEVANAGKAITLELSELHMMLEAGKISETEFDRREQGLLDRLDEIQGEDPLIEEEDEEGDEDEEFEEYEEEETEGK